MSKHVLQGRVLKDAKDKSVVVRVERKIKHPLYQKFIRRSKKYMAHDEGNRCKAGELVRIQECRPLSKYKCWEVLPDQV